MNAAKRMYFLQSEYLYITYLLTNDTIPSHFSLENMPKIVLPFKNVIFFFFAFIDQESSF